jgi:ribosomal protein S18 acetylase RimI-like enzyme
MADVFDYYGWPLYSFVSMSNIRFRQACADDGAHLALFADMATRRLSSYVWNLSALDGQSMFEVGRSVICSDTENSSYFRNWRVAELNGAVIGALNAYVLPPPATTLLPTLEPLSGPRELKVIAAQTFYLSTVALYQEYRGLGLGVAMLNEAGSMAQTSGATQLSLMLGSFNTEAHRLYLRYGFKERARRPFVAFEGSDTQGEWILMQKDLLR